MIFSPLFYVKVIHIRIRISFIARYVYTYKEFVFCDRSYNRLLLTYGAVQQNNSDRTKKKQITKINRTSK